eukprot:COSAG04_NODE_341_length_16294_cov_8.682618_10_plen_78_part_00
MPAIYNRVTTYRLGACGGHDAVLAVADDEAGGRPAAAEEGAGRARLPLPRPPGQRHVQKRVLPGAPKHASGLSSEPP